MEKANDSWYAQQLRLGWKQLHAKMKLFMEEEELNELKPLFPREYFYV